MVFLSLKGGAMFKKFVLESGVTGKKVTIYGNSVKDVQGFLAEEWRIVETENKKVFVFDPDDLPDDDYNGVLARH